MWNSIKLWWSSSNGSHIHKGDEWAHRKLPLADSSAVPRISNNCCGMNYLTSSNGREEFRRGGPTSSPRSISIPSCKCHRNCPKLPWCRLSNRHILGVYKVLSFAVEIRKYKRRSPDWLQSKRAIELSTFAQNCRAN